MKVLAINGSARKGGNTAAMIEEIFSVLKSKGAETETIELAGKSVHGCIACYKCAELKNRKCAAFDDIVNVCIEKMEKADAIIFASPVYFCDLTPEMKALIDRAGIVCRCNGNILKRKIGTSIASVRRAGAIHTLNSMNAFFLIQEMIIPGSCYWNLGFGGKEKDMFAKDEEGKKTMQVLAENIFWLGEKIQSKETK